ncbi:MAG TPA: HAMP domain-containing sensor histidine kinase [Solirubrobacteraceae bacterium]|nr:HAMP domain-containing sensor histidine kinase [Solirubrobacteraceae bacterium]
MRRRLPAGLRFRLLLALLVTSAVTLGVAALIVLPPLQDRLRDQTVESLEDAALATAPAFEARLAAVRSEARQRGEPVDFETYDSALYDPAFELRKRVSARVLVMYRTLQSSDPDEASGFIYDSEAFTQPEPATLRAGLDGLELPQTEVSGDSVTVTRPLNRGEATLIAVRDLSEVESLVSEVRNRFLVAAAVGLAVAALLAIVASSTLLRRLARLRAAALRMTEEGPDAQMPHDERRDEVGDLARALGRMQEELRRQEAARRAFVSTASHELRTPLTMLQGTMELLEDDLRAGRLDVADGLQQVQTARIGLNRLSTLAGELLDLSRLDAAVPLRAEPVELGEIVRAVAAEFELRAERRDTPIELTLPPSACWGRGDPDAIARVARILLDNALRYGPPGAPVHVGAHVEHGQAMITVADAGTGIPEAERERIFERFHRGSAAGSASGFGLGLAIGRELARRMGGELSLDESLRVGTRFALTLRSTSSPAEGPRTGRDRVSA